MWRHRRIKLRFNLERYRQLPRMTCSAARFSGWLRAQRGALRWCRKTMANRLTQGSYRVPPSNPEANQGTACKVASSHQGTSHP